MNWRRLIPLSVTLGLGAALAADVSSAQSTPSAAIQGLCDSLIAAMKQGPALGFAGRRRMLEPEIRQALDLPLMTRLAVGPTWRTLAPEQQAKLVEAFSDYSIANYANRFSGYSGEHFTVDPSESRLANGDVIVHSALATKDPEPVRLDYLMRQNGGSWRVIDVYLKGSISQLAAYRSEFTSVLRQGGAPALVEMIRKKTADLSG
jgi:phospholipid transport system substrate-binding protein